MRITFQFLVQYSEKLLNKVEFLAREWQFELIIFLSKVVYVFHTCMWIIIFASLFMDTFYKAYDTV